MLGGKARGLRKQSQTLARPQLESTQALVELPVGFASCTQTKSSSPSTLR